MGKILYAVYALVVISGMGAFTFAPSSFLTNSNSYYHGSSFGSGGGGSYSGGGGGGHK